MGVLAAAICAAGALGVPNETHWLIVSVMSGCKSPILLDQIIRSATIETVVWIHIWIRNGRSQLVVEVLFRLASQLTIGLVGVIFLV